MLVSEFLEMLSARYARERLQSSNQNLTWKSREEKGSQIKLGYVSLLYFLILSVLTSPKLSAFVEGVNKTNANEILTLVHGEDSTNAYSLS